MRIRAHYIRMPDLEEAWIQAADKPQGQAKLLKKFANFTLLVIDEWIHQRIHAQHALGTARIALRHHLDGVLHPVC